MVHSSCEIVYAGCEIVHLVCEGVHPCARWLIQTKLYHYGLSQEACQLLLNYYSNRKQRVKIGDIISEWRNVY